MSRPTESGASGADYLFGGVGPDAPTNIADSAGQPWAGRTFSPSAFTFDTGEISQSLADAFERFNTGRSGQGDVVAALAGERLLVPVIAEAGETSTNDSGLTIDKSQELSLVTVAGPDGRPVLPAFTAVETLTRWNRTARPIPVDARRVALAAAAEKTDLIVVDPGSFTEFVLRRTAIQALALGESWTPPWLDESVITAFSRSVAEEPRVRGVDVTSGDPRSTLEGPELLVVLTLVPGLGSDEVGALIEDAQRRWRESSPIVERVESIGIQIRPAS